MAICLYSCRDADLPNCDLLAMERRYVSITDRFISQPPPSPPPPSFVLTREEMPTDQTASQPVSHLAIQPASQRTNITNITLCAFYLPPYIYILFPNTSRINRTRTPVGLDLNHVVVYIHNIMYPKQSICTMDMIMCM